MLFFFARTVRSILGNIAQTAASAGSLVYLWTQAPVTTSLAVTGAVLAAMATVALLRYWCFRFRLGEDGVLIRQGVFRKSELDVRFNRIQGVNVEQSPVYRLLDLATLSFDTAGSTKLEGHLPAVSRQFADALRRRIEGRLPPPNEQPSTEEAGTKARKARVLLRLDGRDMVRIGVTDRSVLGALAFLPILYQPYQETIHAVVARIVDAATAEFAQLGLLVGSTAVAGVALALLALLLMVTIASAFLRYHDFVLLLEGSAFRSRSGLLTRKETVVEAGKIQQLVLIQSMLMRWFRRYRLRVLPAASGIPTTNPSGQVVTQRLVVPLLDADLVSDLRARMFPSEGEGLSLVPAKEPFTGISPYYMRGRVLGGGIVPALAATVVLLPLLGPSGLWCLAWIAPATALAWQSWRRRGYMHDDHGLSSRSGLIGYRVNAFLFRKAQAVSVARSPLQRRKGLATLRIHLASDMVSVPYIDYGIACRLRDYILYKAESSRLSWH